ncbi:hypothetical protein [Haliangium sp. UPWRP_2]|uniref:hypothetical protein n=1 Tax=Haliangium sp. UPWRP_2 TaxID=1931276 RepID=UPI00130489BD|nr:hypothetical protein [Haliangium sp. UPWRP_2]
MLSRREFFTATAAALASSALLTTALSEPSTVASTTTIGEVLGRPSRTVATEESTFLAEIREAPQSSQQEITDLCFQAKAGASNAERASAYIRLADLAGREGYGELFQRAILLGFLYDPTNREINAIVT